MKPRCLDLYCGAGGAAVGLHRAGFEVVGVDNRPMPRYPFEFHCGDALAADTEGFHCIWASPPCQAYTISGHNERARGRVYPDLMAATRVKLQASGLPWIIENVPGAPMRADVVLCGSMFGLNLVRHRLLELSDHFHLIMVRPCQHAPDPITVCGHSTPSRNRERRRKHGLCPDVPPAERKIAMGIDWMNRRELAQAVPPAYSEFLGRIMMKALT